MAEEMGKGLGGGKILQRPVPEVKAQPMKEVTLIFPHQLFENHPAVTLSRPVFLIEEFLFFIVSSWKDSISLDTLEKDFLNFVQVPQHGVFTDVRKVSFTQDAQVIIDRIWQIGGDRGWYAGNLLWSIRGFLDTLVGGVGLRRGRRSPTDLKPGDALDFWRVLVADKQNGRLLLLAEMKLPGEAWLEFKLRDVGDSGQLTLTATFRPLGLWGRLYWYLVLPFHEMIFPRLARKIVAVQND